VNNKEREMYRVNLEQIREGSVVMIRGCFGTGPSVRARITEVCEEVKNGRPGVDYVTEKGDSHWAYLDAVDSVVVY
jgi:hypothetical protein